MHILKWMDRKDGVYTGRVAFSFPITSYLFLFEESNHQIGYYLFEIANYPPFFHSLQVCSDCFTIGKHFFFGYVICCFPGFDPEVTLDKIPEERP